MPEGPEVPVEIGDRVVVNGMYSGVLRYVGPVQFSHGIWCGVELDDPEGQHDGKVHGHRYYNAVPGHGKFVKKNLVTKELMVYEQALPDAFKTLQEELAAVRDALGESEETTIELRKQLRQSQAAVEKENIIKGTRRASVDGPDRDAQTALSSVVAKLHAAEEALEQERKEKEAALEHIKAIRADESRARPVSSQLGRLHELLEKADRQLQEKMDECNRMAAEHKVEIDAYEQRLAHGGFSTGAEERASKAEMDLQHALSRHEVLHAKVSQLMKEKTELLTGGAGGTGPDSAAGLKQKARISELTAEVDILEHKLQQSALSLAQAQDDVRERDSHLAEMRARAQDLQDQVDEAASAKAKERRAHAGTEDQIRQLETGKAALEERVRVLLGERDALRLQVDETAAENVAVGKKLRSVDSSIRDAGYDSIVGLASALEGAKEQVAQLTALVESAASAKGGDREAQDLLQEQVQKQHAQIKSLQEELHLARQAAEQAQETARGAHAKELRQLERRLLDMEQESLRKDLEQQESRTKELRELQDAMEAIGAGSKSKETQLLAQVDALSSDVASANKALEGTTAALRQAESQVADLSAQLQAAVSKPPPAATDEDKEEAMLLQVERDSALRQASQLQSKVNELSEQMTARVQAIQQESARALKLAEQQHETEMAALRESLSKEKLAARDREADLEAALDKASTQKASRGMELANQMLQGQLNKQSLQLKQMQEQLGRAQSDVTNTTSQDEMNSLVDKLNFAESDKSKLAKSLAAAEAEQARLQAAVATAEKNTRAAQEEAKRLEAKLRATPAAPMADTSRQHELEMLRSDYELAQGRLELLQEAEKDYKEEIADLRDEISELEGDLELQRERYTQLSSKFQLQ